MTEANYSQQHPFLDVINQNLGIAWQFEAAFHRDQILKTKKGLGKDCTYLSHEKRGDENWIKALLINQIGGKDEVFIQIEDNLSNFREAEYKDLMTTLGKRLYDRSAKTV